jgi:hypothetical protein
MIVVATIGSDVGELVRQTRGSAVVTAIAAVAEDTSGMRL